VEATAVNWGITVDRNSSNTVVRGLGFAHYADKAMIMLASHVQLEKNTFAWNGFSGLSFVGGTDAVVRGNTFSYNALTGINGDADRILLEGNTISYNNIEHFRKTGVQLELNCIKLTAQSSATTLLKTTTRLESGLMARA
jgi:hypothetical protein